MECIFYTCNDDIDKLNKTLENPINAQCNIINDTTILSPVIVVDSSYINKNYVFIPSLNRYYFVDNITISNNMVIMNLTIDCIYTYRDIINNTECFINRVEDYHTSDLIDNLISVDSSNYIDCKKVSDEIITKDFSYIIGVR